MSAIPRIASMEPLRTDSPYVCTDEHAFSYPPHIHVTPFTGNPIEEGDAIAADSAGNVHHLRVLWEAR